MITVSGDLLQKFAKPDTTFSPIKRVVYYDTPYSVPSWGFKRVFYKNGRQDGVFHDDELYFADRDSVIAHGWGQTGPPVLGGYPHYLVSWNGYFKAEHTGIYKFYGSFDDGIAIYVGTGAARTAKTPESLISSEQLYLNPTDPLTVNRAPWFYNGTTALANKDDIVTYSGWVSLTEGEWYPLRVEYGKFDVGPNTEGNVLVRYEEPDFAYVFGYQDASWHYNEVLSGDGDIATFMDLAFVEDLDWAIGTAAFGTADASQPTNIDSTITTAWTAGTPTTPTILLLRREFTLGAQEALTVKMAVDKDATVYINGRRIEKVSNSNNPALDQYEMYIPKEVTIAGTNLVAVYLEDDGGMSYFDMRIQETSNPNANNIEPQPEIRKVLSAGIVNYPATVAWANADDADFITSGVGTDRAYEELRGVSTIKGSRGLNKVGQYVFRLPLSEDEYRPVKGSHGIYKHVDSDVFIRQGRLVDIEAGYQTQCRNYANATQTCNLGITSWATGGYLSPNLCSTVNPGCPFQQAMPGDYVKRFRGRITKLEAVRDKEGSYLEVTCEDNLHYLQSAINENYPDKISYAIGDYNGSRTSGSSPDGVNYPVAWDGFDLKTAFHDLCIKAGIDPSYLYAVQSVITSGFDFERTKRLKVEDGGIFLTKPSQYGNAIFSGPAGDPEADDAYIWKQSFGDPLIDMATNLADNYGFFFTADVDGSMVLKSRSTPEFALAASTRWDVPSTWSREVDKRALGGSYLYSNGDTAEVSVVVEAQRFDLIMGLETQESPKSWFLPYNEAVLTSGYKHGVYTPADVLDYNSSPQELPIFGVTNVQQAGLTFPAWNAPQPAQGTLKFHRGNQTWVLIRPKYNMTLSSINLELANGFKYVDPRVWQGSALTSYTANVLIGEFGGDADLAGLAYLQGTPTWLTSGTYIVVDHPIDDYFTYVTPTSVRIPTLDYTIASGTTYAIRFDTKLWYNGSEVDLDYQVNAINNSAGSLFLFQNVVWNASVNTIGTRISESASPSVLTSRLYYWDKSTPAVLNQFRYNDVFASPAWYDYETTPSSGYYLSQDSTLFVQLSINDDIADTDLEFGVRVLDANGTQILHRNYSNLNVRTDENIRFSTEGIDLSLGYNPSIFTFRAEALTKDIPNTYMIPEKNTYTVFVSGTAARVEGIGIYPVDIYSRKMSFDTSRDLYALGVNQDSRDIRNDVVVVGRLKGAVIDPNTGQVINPNNPELDYVYSRAIDVNSVSNHWAENSVGHRESFVIFEPGVANQEHADWLAVSVLDRYKKAQDIVTMEGLAVPYLDIEDSIEINDSSLWTVTPSNKFWIEETEETIESSKYEQTLSLTPLPPWPSFVPTPPPDIFDFVDNDTGFPNLIVDIEMTDQFGAVRWDGADTPGTNYDPYECDGSSLVNNVNKTNKLQVKYRLLVGGELNVRVRDKEGGNIAIYLVGGGDEFGTNITFARRSPGEYTELWDAIDYFGTSRLNDSLNSVRVTQGIITESKNTNYWPGIFAKGSAFGDGRYYVEFEFHAFEDSYHTQNNAHIFYSTDNLATGSNLNDASYGAVISADRHASFWKLTLGTNTTIKINTSPASTTTTPSSGSYDPTIQDVGPRSASALLSFTSKSNASLNQPGLHIWFSEDPTLTSPNREAMANRKVAYRLFVDDCNLFYAPKEENTYTAADASQIVTQRYQGANDSSGNIISYPGGGGTGYFLRQGDPLDSGPVAVSDGVFAEEHNIGPGIAHNDQYHYNLIMQLKNLPRKRMNGGNEYIKQDSYVALDPLSTRLVFNPAGARIGHKYNMLPAGELKGLHDQIILENTTYYKNVSFWRQFTSKIGYRAACLLFASRWYNFVYDINDKSGRQVSVSNTFNEKVGIGKVPIGSGNADSSYYAGKILVRAHWVPVAADSSAHSGALLPDYKYLDSSEDAHYAFQNYDDPNWDGISDPNGVAIQNHVVPCIMQEKGADQWLDPTIVTLEAFTTVAWDSTIAPYLFYAWPIHHWWPTSTMGTNKQLWSNDPATDGNAYWLGHCPENGRE